MQQHKLFPTLVYTDNVILDIPSMTSFLYNAKQINKGVLISNRGGWQSQPNLHIQPQFTPLVNYVQDIFRKNHKLKINIHEMWGNISSKYNYNVVHHHGNFSDTLSGVYYLQTYNNSGGLAIHSPQDVCIKEYFFPKRGDLICFSSSLIHSVEANLEDKDRISIAFNFQFNQING